MFHQKISFFGYNGCELLLQLWLVCYLKYNLFPFLVSWDVIFFSNWNSHPEVFLGKGVLKICSKFTGEHPCRSVISIKLLCNFIEIALRHECSPINLLHIIRTPFLKKTSEWLLLKIVHQILANLQTDNLIANNLQRKCCTRQALFHLQQLVIFYQHL